MINIFKLLNIGSAVLSIFLMIGCDSIDDAPILDPTNPDTPDTPPVAEVVLEEAKLSAFPLFGITAIKTEIIDPEIVENKETKFGEINITVAAETSLDAISAMITSKELNLSKFSITPGNDIKLSYVDGKTNLYTINNATDDKEELLHYTVSITKEAVIVPETLELTSFKFEKSKNPNLPNDIEIARTVENLANDKIYLFVPVGTDFTNLVPTITYTGTTLHYHEGPLRSSVEKIYTENTSMNFKYPNSILLEIKNKNNDKSKTINVIVDVINPLKIEETFFDVYLSDGVLRADHVIQWTNQGNHLLEYGKEYTQENQDPVGIHYLFDFYTTMPSGGLAPGDSDHIVAAIDFPLDHPQGVYKTTAVFYPRIKDNAEIDDLLEPARMDVIAHFVW